MGEGDPLLKTYPDGSFRLTQIVSKSLRVYYRNIIPFSLISTSALLPTLLYFFSRTLLAEQDSYALVFGAWLVNLIAYTILNVFLLAIIVHAAFQDFSGSQINWRHSIQRAVKRLPDIVVIMLSNLPVYVVFYLFLSGSLYLAFLLLVPVLYLTTRWYVALSSCVIENIAALSSLARSRDLTAGFRWKVLLLVLGSYLAIYGGNQLIAETGWEISGQVVATLVWQGIAGAFNAVLGMLAYYHLRVAKEGADMEKFAAVFD